MTSDGNYMCVISEENATHRKLPPKAVSFSVIEQVQPCRSELRSSHLCTLCLLELAAELRKTSCYIGPGL